MLESEQIKSIYDLQSFFDLQSGGSNPEVLIEYGYTERDVQVEVEKIIIEEYGTFDESYHFDIATEDVSIFMSSLFQTFYMN